MTALPAAQHAQKTPFIPKDERGHLPRYHPAWQMETVVSICPLIGANGQTRIGLLLGVGDTSYVFGQPTPRRHSAGGCCGGLAADDPPLCRAAQRMPVRLLFLFFVAMLWEGVPGSSLPGFPRLVGALYPIFTSLSSRFDICQAIEYNRFVFAE